MIQFELTCDLHESKARLEFSLISGHLPLLISDSIRTCLRFAWIVRLIPRFYLFVCLADYFLSMVISLFNYWLMYFCGIYSSSSIVKMDLGGLNCLILFMVSFLVIHWSIALHDVWAGLKEIRLLFGLLKCWEVRLMF